MKRFLLLVALPLFITPQVHAGTFIEWEDAGNPPVHGGTITNCGAPKLVDFLASYAYNTAVSSTGVPNPSCPGGFGANPYRIRFDLYRDNTWLGSQVAQYSSCWARHLFTGIPAQPGTYRADVKFERRPLFGWQTVESTSTPGILGVNSPAIPDFKINGLTVPAGGAPVQVSGSHPIILDGSITQCATKYLIGAEESYVDWNRTFKYEWSKWFSGAPPSMIYLQLLATTYSHPPDWIGTGDTTRQGAPLAGGFLDSPTNVQPRHYRVALCTGEPAWACKHALIRVVE